MASAAASRARAAAGHPRRPRGPLLRAPDRCLKPWRTPGRLARASPRSTWCDAPASDELGVGLDPDGQVAAAHAAADEQHAVAFALESPTPIAARKRTARAHDRSAVR